MTEKRVYLKCDRTVQVQGRDVFLKELGEVQCGDDALRAKLKAVKLYCFQPSENRAVISVLTVIREMEKVCPGICVENVGEGDILVERVTAPQRKGPALLFKVVFVSLVSFFGTAFTIMAYHNDIGIHRLFVEVYRIFMGVEPVGVNPLEVSYSLGLAVGILVFFNHVGRRRLTPDPTPIEVSIRQYEEDVDKTLIMQASREGKEE
ncbi:MAG: stage V sporulation protein AA [Acetatifactor sp.]|nr:stage V sporulation protein AA [Acetatifactor sp.]